MSDVLTPPAAVQGAGEAEAAASAPLPAPRIRWAAVIWGLALAGLAAAVLWVITSADRYDSFVDWLTTLSPAAFGGFCVLAVGVLLLVSGVVGVIRRLQSRATR